MSDSPPSSSSTHTLKKPLLFFVLPFIVYFPYWWLMHDVLPSSAAHGPITVDHMRVHYGVFWSLTYFPFALICFVSAVVMLARRVRLSVAARWLLVPAGLVASGVLLLLILMLTGH